MKKAILASGITGLIIFLIGCAPIITISNSSSDANDPQNHLGDMHIPDYKEKDFKAAADMVIKIINSADFEGEVRSAVQRYSTGGDYSAAWNGWVAEKIVAEMKDKIKGLEVSTYGGLKGFFLHLFSGNIAFDGSVSGPILMNRSGMHNRSIADLCNTIAHETAHRVGMTHPHSSFDLKTAQFEPPYVIGSIVEKLASNYPPAIASVPSVVQ